MKINTKALHLHFLFALILVITSCQKEEIITSPEYQDFLPMEIGNYWLYQTYEIDESGNFNPINKFDSVVISKDTFINQLKYYVFDHFNNSSNKSPYISNILRDSLSYVVDNQGNIHFSSTDYSDSLKYEVRLSGQDTIFDIVYKMIEQNFNISVPAGEFETKLYQGTVNAYIEFSNAPNPRTIEQFYAEGIGLIKKTDFYFISNHRVEQRLIEYNLK